jgi:hypothetical protein
MGAQQSNKSKGDTDVKSRKACVADAQRGEADCDHQA